MEKKPYIAYPKKLEKEDDIEELSVFRNRYYGEYGPKYFAFQSEDDLKIFIDFSFSQVKWFIDDKDRMSVVGVGDSVKDAIDNLLKKINASRSQLKLNFS